MARLDGLTHLQKLTVALQRPKLSAEENDFCKAWIFRSCESHGRVALCIIGVFQIGLVVNNPLASLKGGYHGLDWWASFVSLMAIGLWYAFSHSTKSKSIFIFVFALIVMMGSQGFRISDFQNHRLTAQSLPIVEHIGFTMMTAVSLAVIPYAGWEIGVLLSILAMAILQAAWAPFGDVTPVMHMSGLFFSVALVFHVILLRKAMKEARREYAARKVLDAMEKQKLEVDLAIAKRIQESMSPFEVGRDDPYHARLFYRKSSQVGGDWAALRKDLSGAYYVLVADAAGKGIQAALVMHAVQSLWAESLGKPNFDPKGWLERVNWALCQLGSKRPHMITIGIAKFSYGRCKYLSAGHVPLYIVKQSPQDVGPTVEVLLAPGTPLGLIEDPTLGVAEASLTADSEIFLGSDGYFQSGSRQKKSEILKLRTRLWAGEDVFADIKETKDDQTLIWLSLNAVP